MRKKARKAKIELGGMNVDVSTVTAENPKFENLFHTVMHAIHYNMADKDRKKQVIQYAKAAELNVKALNTLDDFRFSVVGKYAYILNNGGEIIPSHREGFDRHIARLVEEGVERLKESKTAEKAPSAPVLTVQDRVREQVGTVCEEFDQALDKILTPGNRKATVEVDPQAMMLAADFKAVHATWVKKFYADEIAELEAVLKGKDEQLVEGYSVYTKTKIRAALEFLQSVVRAAEMISKAKKAQRRPRVKKAPTLEKVVARLKFKTSDNEYGVASVNPVSVVGAKELWVFNTKYRKLGRYVAADGDGIQVKGASLVNYDEGKSVQKALRKPKDQLADFMTSGKVKLRKFLEEIRGVETRLNGRLNDNIVLLKAVK